MANWVTETEAQDLTGEVLSDAQITKAQIIIDMFTGVTTAVAQEKFSEQNLIALKRATALEAAWLVRNPDVLTRWDSAKITQSGVSIELESSDAMILAPGAKHWLKRLSWKNRRTIRPRRSSRSNIFSGDNSEFAIGRWRRI